MFVTWVARCVYFLFCLFPAVPVSPVPLAAAAVPVPAALLLLLLLLLHLLLLQNEPLCIRVYGDTEELPMQFAAYAALDVIDEQREKRHPFRAAAAAAAWSCVSSSLLLGPAVSCLLVARNSGSSLGHSCGVSLSLACACAH